MKTCWAKNISSCSGKISREHLISKGVFEKQFLYVKGLPWCKGEEKKVSIASLTSKVLCKFHNNALSEVDKAGINAIRVFESILPEKYRSLETAPFEKRINGHLFERWLLKTSINLAFQGDMHIGVGMADSLPGIPSQYLLEVVFGNMNFTHKMGLYTLCYEGLEKFRVGSISVCPIHKNNSIGGFLFHIRGFDFFLSLFPGHSPPQLKTIGLDLKSGIDDFILNATPEYRKTPVSTIDGSGLQKDVLFNWNV